MGRRWPAAGLGAQSVAMCTWDLLKEVAIIFITSIIFWPQFKQQEGNTAPPINRKLDYRFTGQTCSTGEGNGKPLQYSCIENPMNSMKRQTDRTLKDEPPTPQVSRCPICYWRTVEKQIQKEWRDRAKAKTTPSCGCDW